MNRSLSASDLLTAWEMGIGKSRARRSLGLLAMMDPDEDPATLSIGARDARLLRLRSGAFGSTLVGVATCPACRELVEWSFDASVLDVHVEGPGEHELEHGRFRVGFRLPNSGDVDAVAAVAEPKAARAALLERCIARATSDEQPLPVRDLPDEVTNAVVEQMAAADPQADVRFSLKCDCGTAWDAPFDIESFLWAELGAWAARLLNEVHLLASAYGWRESDILGLSAWRRQFYLSVVCS